MTFVIDPITLMLFAAGFFFFMYGFVELLWKMKEGQPDQDGKKHMIYGIIGMLVMFSVGGILNLLAGTFGLDLSGNSINPSSMNVQSGSFFQQ